LVAVEKLKYMKYYFRYFGTDMVCSVVVHSCWNSTSWSKNHRCRIRIHQIICWSISQPYKGGNVSVV